ncbi:MAG: membrane protein insertase YidC [Cellvibrio sp.]|nr:membrane protein insertase YidC [Cellvibrio sp.]
MDWQKNILIVAIFAVCLLLFLRFQDFDGHTPIATNTTSSNSSSSAGAIPNFSSQTSVTNNVKSETSIIAPNLINVKTDSLLVTIDPYGGDIISVSLPEHYASLENPDKPFKLLERTENHFYVAQSGLVGINGTDTAESRPTFSFDSTQYELSENENNLVVDLVLHQNDVKIIKRFTFTRGEYAINVEYIVQNKSQNTWSAKLYGRIVRDGKTHDEVNQYHTKKNMFQLNPFLGVATSTNEENYKKLTFDDINKTSLTFNHQGGWISLVQHYFVSAWIPSKENQNQYTIQKIPNSEYYSLAFETQDILIATNQEGSVRATFYAGPKDTVKLESLSPYLDLTVDYGMLWWISKPLFALMKFIHQFLGNWGLAIIGLTLIVKLVFYKLSKTSYVSMAKMKKLQPKLAELKERYGEDRQRFSQEMMKLYKTEKVNPLGGCLPLLIQMPVFMALYFVLMEAVELRHAPFFGWITDLSVKDPLFILPILYGISQWITMKFSPQPPDPMQAKIMQMLPFVFTFMFLFFPSGLVLYWLTNNILQIIQQQIITKQIEKADAKAK